MKNKIFKQSFTNVCFFGSCSVFCKKTPPLKSLYDSKRGVIPFFDISQKIFERMFRKSNLLILRI